MATTNSDQKLSHNQILLQKMAARHRNRANVLENQMRRAGNPPSIAKIIELGSEACGIESSVVLSKSRKSDVVDCRRVIASIARMYGYTYVQIGKALGRDHASVIYYVSTYNAQFLHHGSLRSSAFKLINKLVKAA